MATHRVLLSLLAAAVLAAAQASVLVSSPRTQSTRNDDLYKLPDKLLIGAGLSATQSEGATSEDGKAESALDRAVHSPQSPLHAASNDVAADHYHRFKEDLALAKQMKFTSHRFSISWSRILPNGDLSVVNEKAIEHYREYIKEVKENKMEPLVTMYHFDHPFVLENRTGGWTNKTMVDYFVDYADLLFQRFGSEVKYWNPINEANMYCIFLPQQLQAAGLEDYDSNTFYQCVHNNILAHAKTYRLYKEKYYKEQQGFVGTSSLFWPAKPATTDYADIMAANTVNDMFGGTPLHPFVYGDYPEITRRLVDEQSIKDGLEKSKLPRFTDEEKEILIKDGPSTDFVALNVYSAYTVSYDANITTPRYGIIGPMLNDMPFVKMTGGGFESADSDVLKIALLWTWNNYRLPIIITENGYGDTRGHGVEDYDSRGHYYSVMLRSLVATMKNYSVPVISFHAWSLIDSYEFSGGYDQRPFGLIHVDYANKTLNRTIKKSSKFFIDMAESGYVPDIGNPSNSAASILVPSALWVFLLQRLLGYASV